MINKEENISKLIEDCYSKYTKYIILDRAIPDIRDGLKPVQRRILYAMYKINLFYNSNYKKCAKVVGEVIGKYHPHGDSSVYQALLRISQSWKCNIPLIEIQGNNGSIDGDSGAAMRYTEARLSKASSLYMVEELKNDKIVNKINNFDDTEKEPEFFTIIFSKFTC